MASAADRRRRPTRAPRLTVRGWALLAVAVAAFVATRYFARQEFAYLGCFLLAVVGFGYAWTALRRVQLTVRRRFVPESAPAGEPVDAVLLLQNWGAMRTPAVTWVDPASAPMSSTAPSELPALPGFSARRAGEPEVQRLHYRPDTTRRGAHTVGPLLLTFADPFGMARRSVAVGETDSLVVTPAVYDLARADLRLSTGDGSEQTARRLVGAGEPDVIARRYQPGDSVRKVHWPATARHGELMVKQDDQRNDQDAVVLLDASSFPGDDAASDAFEWAVSGAASVAQHLVAEGFGVRLVGFGERSADAIYVDVAGSQRVAYDLAFATPAGAADPDAFRAAVGDASLTSPDAPPVFAFVADRPGAEQGLQSLAAMSSHPVAFVVRSDADLEVGRAGGAGSEVGTSLRRAGWTVVDVDPDEAVPSVWRALGEARGLA
ncbi:hypothetical protein GCM10010988_06130 [Cnuibacter physcomitrellae]|uniref:DUF58 domain-containing protein n=1 Tax=Cnuibacter physcomitrellae TaxID=1619308 RepID=A0A1X9LU62_9MICO|nr:DUF58 domain-containing protein [Cnuibacter physcomitrellae]ARJ05520.1 hypothetical protein B5808_10000 [Cnuibacter physcomitrellae]GGI35874.1 hypothetical protein GCM10010988_06130 [Cnuibacter physcomitrellae]